jgi:hypothetical protein
MKTKIIILTFIILLLLILCIYLENIKNNINEHFVCTIPKDINLNKCNDNDLNIKMINNKTKVDNIYPLRTPSFDNIISKIRTNLDLDNQMSQFNLNLQHQDSLLNDINTQIKDISDNKIFNKNDIPSNYRSVTSLGESQFLNLIPLSNEKYMISLNGKDKCLTSNSLNKNTIEACNLDNANQYFSLDFINNDIIYKNKTLGQIYNIDTIVNDTDIKYPFAFLKSSTDNCVGVDNKSLTVGPCTASVKQRWKPSMNPIICKK